MRTIHLPSLVFAFAAMGIAQAAPPPLDPPRINEQDRVILFGDVPAPIAHAKRIGRTSRHLFMKSLILALKRKPEDQARFERLGAEQQDPASPDFHKWLTPEQLGERFGPSKADLELVENWLTGHGFTIESEAPDRMTLTFSGSVANVERTFRTRIDDYLLEGSVRHANTYAPSIPRSLSDLIRGVVSLSDIPLRPGVPASNPAPR